MVESQCVLCNTVFESGLKVQVAEGLGNENWSYE
jgi:hypothetical protein